MNPLTLVKRIQNINSKEAALGISEQASWHAKYKESAYVFVGGIPFDLTEGDLLAIFAQYGEIVDVNLVRDKGTGKSKGFAFVAYEDQRSTNLAVDNLNGAQILGRIIRVDHVSNYKKKEEEDEETVQQKREARGVCRAFQKGECTRGAGCKFSHDEQRAANTGWGHEDKSPRWGHDKFEGSKKSEKGSGSTWSNRAPEASRREGFTSGDKDSSSRAKGNEMTLESRSKQSDRREERRSRRHDDDELVPKTREDRDWREEKRSRRHDVDEHEPKSREDHNRKEENRLRRHDVNDIEPNVRDHDRREEKRSRRRDGDEYEPKSRENHDRVEGKSSRRLESDSYIRDHDRREEKRSRRHE